METATNMSMAETRQASKTWQKRLAGRSFSDSTKLLALAQTEGCLLVTADRALHNALHATRLAQLLLWVEDIK